MVNHKNCLVVHASCGEGHKKAASALAEHLKAPCVDLLDYCHPLIKKIYSDGYRFAVKNIPLIWFLLFESSRLKVIRIFLNWMHGFLFSSFLHFLKGKEFRFIILTHFFPIPLAARLKTFYAIKIITVVTDFKAHPLWIDERVDRYFVASSLSQRSLLSQGIEQKKVEVTGLPIRNGFSRSLDKEAIRRKLSLDDKPVILVFSSTQGKIPFFKEILTRLKDDFNILIIIGKDKKAKQFIDKLNSPSIKYFTYYEAIWELMEISFCIITKPGGLSVAEALHKRKPLIFTHFIWGQEKGNLDICVKSGVGFFAPKFKQLRETVYRLKESRDIFRDFKQIKQDIFISLDNFIKDD